MIKKLFVLASSVMVAGCFICHRPGPQQSVEATPEIVAQTAPVSKDKIISQYTIEEVANFMFDSKDPLPNGNKVDEIVQEIQGHSDTLVHIVGHTDNIGTEVYNKKLSLDRANSVAEELIQRGVDSRQILIDGAGESNPIDSNNTEKGRARNRRVDVVLIQN